MEKCDLSHFSTLKCTLFINGSTCGWGLCRCTNGSLLHFCSVWGLWLLGSGRTLSVVATRCSGGMQARENLWRGCSPPPLLSAGILQDSCPTCFTKTQAYFLNTNWDRHSLQLVWRLKFIVVKTECVAPRVALLSGPKQIHLFGRCCNPIYLQGILFCYSLICIKGYLGCGQAKTLTKLTTLICCFYFESAVAFCDSC